MPQMPHPVCVWAGPPDASTKARQEGTSGMEQLIISLLSGAAGGNIVAKILKNLDLGPVGNSIAGILGGGLGSQILASLGSADAAAAAGGLDIGSILSSVASGGVGGGVLMAIVGIIKSAMAK